MGQLCCRYVLNSFDSRDTPRESELATLCSNPAVLCGIVPATASQRKFPTLICGDTCKKGLAVALGGPKSSVAAEVGDPSRVNAGIERPCRGGCKGRKWHLCQSRRVGNWKQTRHYEQSCYEKSFHLHSPPSLCQSPS